MTTPVKTMLTQTYYVKKLIKSKNPTEFYKNSVHLTTFIGQKMIQTIKFNDPFLMLKSL